MRNELKNLINKYLQVLIIKALSFLFRKKVIIKSKQKIISVLLYLEIKIDQRVQFTYRKRPENHMELLLIGNEGISHYVYIKEFNKFMSSKIKHIWKKHFCMNFLTNYCEVWLEINGKLKVVMYNLLFIADISMFHLCSMQTLKLIC